MGTINKMDQGRANAVATEIAFQFFCGIRRHNNVLYEMILDRTDISEEDLVNALRVLYNDSPGDLDVIESNVKHKV
jgi:hypothetical protein